jgi:hypothetical protein
MPKVVIYYRQQKYESVESSIEKVEAVINHLETSHTIIGVFLDSYNDRNQLNELLNSPMDKIDILYINQSFDDEFDSKLINLLSKAEQFSVKYIDE